MQNLVSEEFIESVKNDPYSKLREMQLEPTPEIIQALSKISSRLIDETISLFYKTNF